MKSYSEQLMMRRMALGGTFSRAGRKAAAVPPADPNRELAAALAGIETQRFSRRGLFKKGLLFMGGALFGLAFMPRPARAAMAVFDATNLAKNAETAATTLKMLTEAKTHTDELQMIKKLVGIGSQMVGSGRKLLNASNMPSAILGRSQSTTAALPDLKGTLGIDAQGGAADTSALRQALKRVNTTEGLSGAQKAQVMHGRSRAQSEAVEDAYVVGVHARMTAAETPNRVKEIAKAAEEAAGDGGDLRQQIAVLTSAMLLSTEETAQNRYALGTMLQLQGAAHLAQDSGMRVGGPGSGGQGQKDEGSVWGPT